MKIDDKNVISFKDYQEKYTDKDRNENWHNYWETYLEPLYEIEYWKLIDKVNIRDLLEDIIERFDFETVENHMKSVNWTWQDRKTTPTIKNLKSCVLSLIGGICEKSTFTYNPSTSSTGGFYVSLFLINNKPYKIKVEFKKQNGEKITEETNIKLIRKKKLETINNI